MNTTPAVLVCRNCKAEVTLPTKGTPTPRLVEAWNGVGARGVFVCMVCRADWNFRVQAKDIGWLPELEEAFRYQIEREALLADVPGALATCGVPAHWRGASFATCADLPKELVDAARRWAEGPAGTLYLFGAPGCGKTTLAVAILREILERDTLAARECRFTSERGFLDSVKSTFDGGGPGRSMVEMSCELLILDDLAASRLSDWGRAEMAGLIEARHGAELPTVITSNVGPNDLGAAVDGRVASRIAESRLLWGFPARDLRLTGAAGGGAEVHP